LLAPHTSPPFPYTTLFRSPDERFFRAPLEFGTLATALLLDNTDLQRPVVLSDPTVTGYLEHLADDTLARLGDDRSTARRVRRLLDRKSTRLNSSHLVISYA